MTTTDTDRLEDGRPATDGAAAGAAPARDVPAAAVLVAFFPANVYAAFQHAPMGGHAWGPAYLLIRAPLQLFILWWIWRFVLQGVDNDGNPLPNATDSITITNLGTLPPGPVIINEWMAANTGSRWSTGRGR